MFSIVMPHILGSPGPFERKRPSNFLNDNRIPWDSYYCRISLQQVPDYVIFNAAVNKQYSVSAAAIGFLFAGAYLSNKIDFVRIIKRN